MRATAERATAKIAVWWDMKDCPIQNLSSEGVALVEEAVNLFKKCGFWRQLTVGEGTKPGGNSRTAELMLVVQVCTTDTNEAVVATEFEELAKAFAEGARASSPPLPLTVLVVQDNVGISKVAQPDCPLRLLPIPMSDYGTHLDQPTNVLTEARIHDHIHNIRFSISPTTFFQVNTGAAEKLYSLAGDWADFDPDTLLFDVCCGVGALGLTLAHRVGMVIGIERNDSAVSDAKRNAKINGISNCQFICSKPEDVMSSLLTEYLDVSETEEAKPDTKDDLGKQISSTEEISNSEDVPPPIIQEEVLKTEQKVSSEPERSTKPQFKNVVAIVNPPRFGLHEDLIKALRTHPRLKTLVYISCNPVTLVENALELCTPSLEEMPEPFKHVKAMAVDGFPHTNLCQVVMLLSK